MVGKEPWKAKQLKRTPGRAQTRVPKIWSKTMACSSARPPVRESHQCLDAERVYPIRKIRPFYQQARLAQSVEHQTLNLVVVGSSPTLGDSFCQLGELAFLLLLFFSLRSPSISRSLECRFCIGRSRLASRDF